MARLRGGTSAHWSGIRHVNVPPVAPMSYRRVCRLKTRLFMKCPRSFDTLSYPSYAFDEISTIAACAVSGEWR